MSKQLFPQRPNLVHLIALATCQRTEEDAGDHEEGAVLEVICDVDNTFLFLIQRLKKCSCFVNEKGTSLRRRWTSKMVFERRPDSHPALLADDANARAQELSKQPSRVVVGRFYMIVRVFVEGLDVFGLGYYPNSEFSAAILSLCDYSGRLTLLAYGLTRCCRWIHSEPSIFWLHLGR